jgi:hypothetical protein
MDSSFEQALINVWPYTDYQVPVMDITIANRFPLETETLYGSERRQGAEAIVLSFCAYFAPFRRAIRTVISRRSPRLRSSIRENA